MSKADHLLLWDMGYEFRAFGGEGESAGAGAEVGAVGEAEGAEFVDDGWGRDADFSGDELLEGMEGRFGEVRESLAYGVGGGHGLGFSFSSSASAASKAWRASSGKERIRSWGWTWDIRGKDRRPCIRWVAIHRRAGIPLTSPPH